MRKHSKDYFHLFYSQLFANTGDILTIVGLIAIVLISHLKRPLPRWFPLSLHLAFLWVVLFPIIFINILRKSKSYLYFKVLN